MATGTIPQYFDLTGNTVILFRTVESVQDNITAHSGGTKAAAYQLTAGDSRVTTVGAAADSVLAPYPAVVGASFAVRNDDASNAMQLFGQGTDTVNGAATGTGISIAIGKKASFRCYTAGAWIGPVAAA